VIGRSGYLAGVVLCVALSSAPLWIVGRAHADLQIAGYQDRLHDPYYVGADKAFIGTGYSWSGIGRISDPSGATTNWKSLTMISDNYFITADHNKPYRANDPAGPAPKVRFYRTTDPNGEFWESEIASAGSNYVGERIGSTDLWVGKLAETPPSWVERYPLAKRHQATNYLSYTDNDLFVFGQDSPRSFTSLRVGRNEIDSVDLGGNYEFDYDVVNGLGANEAETQGGDSGSPSFFSLGPVPVLAGIHTRTNFDTGVSANLQGIIDTVPEPISVSTGLPGDFDGDFQLTPKDVFNLVENMDQGGIMSYRHGDITGDGLVNRTDQLILYMWAFKQRGSGFFAPSDFDRDGDVDAADLGVIGSNWMKTTQPFMNGDTNGDSIVNKFDVEMFDRNQFRAYFGPLPAPLSPVTGDMTGNGVIDGFDLSIVTNNLSKVVDPGTNGDADGNGIVNSLDVVYVSTRLGSSFGDLNGDHEVGPDDFLILAKNWNRNVAGSRSAGDLNGDGWVTLGDSHTLFGWWSQQGGEFPGMLIPEPTSWLLAACATTLVATRRRRATSPGPC
jgi:hypothetical protein